MSTHVSVFFCDAILTQLIPTNCGCDFSSLKLLKSNPSDLPHDGLKQVSVFKALKVNVGRAVCMDHTLAVAAAPSSVTSDCDDY